MSTTAIKSNFHKLIDKIDNENLLRQFYQALLSSTKKEGKLWDSLTKEEQEDLLLSYEESFDEKNLIQWNDVKEEYKKWPSK